MNPNEQLDYSDMELAQCQQLNKMLDATLSKTKHVYANTQISSQELADYVKAEYEYQLRKNQCQPDIPINRLVNQLKKEAELLHQANGYWLSNINLPDKKQILPKDLLKIIDDYLAIYNMYQHACSTIQAVAQELKLGLGGENIFELVARELKSKTLKECCKALGWQGGTIHQVIDILRRTKQLCLTHKEAEISGDWEVFKAEMYALRLQVGVLLDKRES